ncbi:MULTISPECIES: chalcone isomerase family protein [unclassified Acinetobacter]|uniref:chalcone isomerase family protein n=1 Tax=unclassified Acinetobacter TaxID=196816 RepID=UPI00244B4FB4|nr:MULTISPECIES: chalcone isomerase family protein [unclassified Acinetobacter]MDH0032747.1 chalcone isomerase family protein [Acinetobacter sp. GD04021]MDH0885968.1 chalcone isomerase family protein [Acinetobacter sp. GD03873]MDH1082588.1 chalcone isomerase family protein [Acinetobacter sp. GD03983]MDH2189617.1 chalcone isomerase family protein [Acinetobacter sp. GD03645]MDH2203552.1 chalcone isomerase family protein [Acinetobacter sp. GD03647]
MLNYLRKIGLSVTCLITPLSLVHANTQLCNTAPLIVTSKNVGSVSYYANNCSQNWENQNIRLDFSYNQNIPEWAFKKAATYYLKKNVTNFSDESVLNRITALYHPVKRGDLYTLNYDQTSKQLSLSLNQKRLGAITDSQANQYFKIWFGNSPFNAKLKQQLLNL